VILLDTDVLMYAAGAPHPHKAPSAALLERVALGKVESAVDAEVLQEILHRYRAIRRWREGRRVYDLARIVVPLVLPVTAEIVDAGRQLLDAHPGLGARDALHAAACLASGARAICSYDSDLDVVKGLTRVEPDDV
jgi:hypothetical protein